MKHNTQSIAHAIRMAGSGNAILPGFTGTIAEMLTELLAIREREQQDADKLQHGRDQAKAQLESITGMVAALECDYDRLEALRETRDELQAAVSEAVEDSDLQAATEELAEWPDAEELAELEEAAGDCSDRDTARERIQEDALGILVSATWTPGETPEPEGFEILLCTGGPAVRIVGELDQYKHPDRAWLEYQDWGTPWTEYHGAHDSAALLAYSQQFYFGE